jgi:hypothetical protein
MKARFVIAIAASGLALAIAAQALAVPTNPPIQNSPPADESFVSGSQVGFQATTAAPAAAELDFFVSSSSETNARGVLSRNVDIVNGQLVSGTPATGTVHAANWDGEQPGKYFWQAVYIDCAQDPAPDCLNESATRSFTVTPLPAAAVKSAAQIETFLDHHPRRRIRKRKVRFDFSSNVAGATFSCLFAQGWADCKSPHVFRNLKPGRFKFEVRAAVNDLADPTPASWTFRVLRRSSERKKQNR